MRKRALQRAFTIVLALATVTMLPGLAWAHPHQSSRAHQGEGQKIANGQNHGPYETTDEGHGKTCGGDSAAYGAETAHHGPDSGTPGKADGCYETDSMPPGSDDNNPAID